MDDRPVEFVTHIDIMQLDAIRADLGVESVHYFHFQPDKEGAEDHTETWKIRPCVQPFSQDMGERKKIMGRSEPCKNFGYN
jgi:hypothetical protein